MNYLAHLYLADYTGTSLAGSVLGDAVKGRLRGEYPPAIELGIKLHRRIDTFTDHHPVVRAACARFEPPCRRYAGILLDIYFDHILALRWSRFHAASLGEFASSVGSRIQKEWLQPPLDEKRLDGFGDVLLSYARPDGVATALDRVAQRASRANAMAGALPVLQAQHEEIGRDFEHLFPELRTFCRAEVGRLQTSE